ncbi:MAG: ATP-binding protein [Halofilum sp. (in: g-proteobacteria)]|nr:ATP-binding protein [Halofilum sp. (in: g-proteobacteria)]
MADDRDRLQGLIEHAERLLAQVERVLPADLPAAPEGDALAWRWQRGSRGRGGFVPVARPAAVALDDLHGIDEQKATLARNTRQFVAGLPCNNALLTGARGTGKSSLVKALLAEHAVDGLRLVEVDAADLLDLPDVVAPLAGRDERFLLFADDLAFDADGAGYRSLKALLEGSIASAPDNVVVYATSNRRHLMPEFMSENREARAVDDEIHPGETTEEKISLSERFGLWLSFHPFGQDDYLAIAETWLRRIDPGCPFDAAAREAALQWALRRGSRSGRVAHQFALDWAGRRGLDNNGKGDPR